VPTLLRLLPKSSQQLPVVATVVICLAIVISNSTLFSLATRQMQLQQQHIEFDHRQQIGLWLAKQVQPGETIYLECFGYIGYFSGAHIDDFPGLVSPRVSRLRQEKRLSFHTLVPELKPDWIVARPDEYHLLERLEEVRETYRLVFTFDATEKLGDLDGMPGANYLRGDAIFYVLKRLKD